MGIHFKWNDAAPVPSHLISWHSQSQGLSRGLGVLSSSLSFPAALLQLSALQVLTCSSLGCTRHGPTWGLLHPLQSSFKYSSSRGLSARLSCSRLWAFGLYVFAQRHLLWRPYLTLQLLPRLLHFSLSSFSSVAFITIWFSLHFTCFIPRSGVVPKSPRCWISNWVNAWVRGMVLSCQRGSEYKWGPGEGVLSVSGELHEWAGVGNRPWILERPWAFRDELAGAPGGGNSKSKDTEGAKKKAQTPLWISKAPC